MPSIMLAVKMDISDRMQEKDGMQDGADDSIRE